MVLTNWAVSCPSSRNAFPFLLLDQRWAIPIKARVREVNQAREINEVVNAPKQEQQVANGEVAPLRVVNGIST